MSDNETITLIFKKSDYIFLAHTLKNHKKLIYMTKMLEPVQNELIKDTNKIMSILSKAEKGVNTK